MLEESDQDHLANLAAEQEHIKAITHTLIGIFQSLGHFKESVERNDINPININFLDRAFLPSIKYASALSDLYSLLKRRDEDYDSLVHTKIGEYFIMERGLLPLFISLPVANDHILNLEVLVRILINLTSFIEDGNELHLVRLYKKSFEHPNVLSKLLQIAIYAVSRKQQILLEIIIILLRNVCVIPDLEDTLANTNNVSMFNYGRNDQLISNLYTTKWIEFLLVMTGTCNEESLFKGLIFHLLELFHGLFTGFLPWTIANFSLNKFNKPNLNSSSNSISPSHQSKLASFVTEGNNMKIKKPIRHAKFGGCVQVKLTNGEFQIIGCPSKFISNDNSLPDSLNGNGKRKKRNEKGKLVNRTSQLIEFGNGITSPTSRQIILKTAIKFLQSSFNPFVDCITRRLIRNEIKSVANGTFNAPLPISSNSSSSSSSNSHLHPHSLSRFQWKTLWKLVSWFLSFSRHRGLSTEMISSALDIDFINKTIVIVYSSMNEKDWNSSLCGIYLFRELLLLSNFKKDKTDNKLNKKTFHGIINENEKSQLENETIKEKFENEKSQLENILFYRFEFIDSCRYLLQHFSRPAIKTLSLLIETNHLILGRLEQYLRDKKQILMAKSKIIREGEKTSKERRRNENMANSNNKNSNFHSSSREEILIEKIFDFSKFLQSFANDSIIDSINLYLESHDTNDSNVNRYTSILLRRIFNIAPTCLYRITLFYRFHQILTSARKKHFITDSSNVSHSNSTMIDTENGIETSIDNADLVKTCQMIFNKWSLDHANDPLRIISLFYSPEFIVGKLDRFNIESKEREEMRNIYNDSDNHDHHGYDTMNNAKGLLKNGNYNDNENDNNGIYSMLDDEHKISYLVRKLVDVHELSSVLNWLRAQIELKLLQIHSITCKYCCYSPSLLLSILAFVI